MDRGVAVAKRFELLKHTLDERGRRLFAGAEAHALGYGGVAIVARATKLAISTVRKGRDEVLANGPANDPARVRRRGAGRIRMEVKQPELKAELSRLIEPTTRGDPESPLRWTVKSSRVLSGELKNRGYRVSAQKVTELLHAEGYSLQANSRVKEGTSHPDRNAQFEHINAATEGFIARGVPVVSVDAKKKELVGEHANAGRTWRPRGKPVEVLTYDFPNLQMPKAVPYGVYDVAANKGYVNVGTSHDTPAFAVRTLEKWWLSLGSARYPGASELYVTADGGGSNSSRAHRWKLELQRFADAHRLTVHVSHFPPGTSKWNKIEHRLFSFISMNWRGQPLTSYETVVSLIQATTTSTGLRVSAELDTDQYPLGASASRDEMSGLALRRAAFRGNWNYSLVPRPAAGLAKVAPAKKTPRPRQRTEAEWAKLVAEQAKMRMATADFCKARGLKPQTFLKWRRRVLPKPEQGYWRELVAEYLAVGGSAAAFCRARGIASYEAFQTTVRNVAGPLSRRANAKWRKLVEEQAQSGLSVAAFCRQKGMHTTQLFRWKSRLQREDALGKT